MRCLKGRWVCPRRRASVLEKCQGWFENNGKEMTYWLSGAGVCDIVYDASELCVGISEHACHDHDESGVTVT